MERILVKLRQERSQMESTIFDSPPSDWAGFLKRLGEWKGLGQAISTIEGAIHDEAEEERSR